MTVAQTYRPLTRQQVRKHLVIPSPHYLTLGFAADVLDALDVGHSAKLGKTILPVYEGDSCVGHLERSERPDCPRCKKCHDPSWPCRFGQTRWVNAKGFAKRQFLYNLADASRTRYHFIFLTPGAEGVFRIREAGFGAVALLGSDISEAQIKKLAALGKFVCVACDRDDASFENAVRVRGRLRADGVDASLFPPPGKAEDFVSMKSSDLVANVEGRGMLDAYPKGQEAV